MMCTSRWQIAVLFSALSFGGTAVADSERNELVTVYKSDWQNGLDRRLTLQSAAPSDISIIQMPELGGAALKVTIRRNEDFARTHGVPRSEVAFDKFFRFAAGNEYEIVWVTLIPVNYTIDSQQPEIIMQIHQGINTGSPPFSLMITKNGYQVEVRGGSHEYRSYIFGNPYADEGHPIKWTLRYRPDDTTDSSLTELYREGELAVHCEKFQNAYPNDRSAYLKLGIYKWWWKTRSTDANYRVMYYGNVEVRRRPI